MAFAGLRVRHEQCGSDRGDAAC